MSKKYLLKKMRCSHTFYLQSSWELLGTVLCQIPCKEVFGSFLLEDEQKTKLVSFDSPGSYKKKAGWGGIQLFVNICFHYNQQTLCSQGCSTNTSMINKVLNDGLCKYVQTTFELKSWNLEGMFTPPLVSHVMCHKSHDTCDIFFLI